MKLPLRMAALAVVAIAPLALSTPATAADAAAGKAKAGACAGCHGADGNSANPAWPNLAGQGGAYIAKQLAAFKAGARNNPLMAPMAAPLSEEDMANLGAHFAMQPAKIGAAGPNAAAGETLYRAGKAADGVPACTGCHGPSGAGNGPAAYPALHGQHAAYTLAQLKAFKDGTRDNAMMKDIASRLSDDDMAALADYIQGLH
ncbi:MAG: c-type cytochrome [Gammaproteobacteria bacterium]